MEAKLLEYLQSYHPSDFRKLGWLHASQFSTTETIQVLLDAGADLNQEGSSSVTLLHAATLFKMSENVKLLFAVGAYVTAQDRFGKTLCI